jgi:hypothetical protein
MSGQSSSAPEQPPATPKGLTPSQIGACVGAALTFLSLLVVRELSPPGESGNPSYFLMGVLSGFGGIAVGGVVSAVNFLRRRRKQK